MATELPPARGPALCQGGKLAATGRRPAPVPWFVVGFVVLAAEQPRLPIPGY
ncbi:MAG: hypothetical protein M0Z94_06895 [Dehalococcoidales bacterium]|nr:hypothetical protein [Dehalococcoidales bacterium]